ncbi:MAG: metallophosphoesterase family protein, partial [Hyphomicrobiaceae bacterium]
MTFKFLHTADWHLGKAFGSFNDDQTVLLREARFSAIERITDVARKHGIEHVLVAGDMFDSAGLGDHVLRRCLALLRDAAELTWVILPGNHDPDHERGLWDRIARIGLPNNVIVCRERRPVRLTASAILLPAPLAANTSAGDPTDWFQSAAREPSDIVIGLAHGSAHTFGGDSEAAVQISPVQAESAGVDYLALGDWHGLKQVGDKTWYSGTPEPERYVNNQPGHVVVVEVAGPGAAP